MSWTSGLSGRGRLARASVPVPAGRRSQGVRVPAGAAVVGSRGGGVFTRCALEDAWAQELLGSPRLSALAFAAGIGGAARWRAAEGVSGPVMVWGFDVGHEAFAEAVELFGTVVRVGG